MRKVFVLFLIICTTSCEYFNAKKVASEDILEEELMTFNWNTIDTYPVFETCDEEASKEDLKQCFELTLSNTMSQALQEEIIVVSQDVNETITLEFLISEKGEIALQNILASTVIMDAIPNLETLLKDSLEYLPALLPAIKRNQPVKTAFTLPIDIIAN